MFEVLVFCIFKYQMTDIVNPNNPNLGAYWYSPLKINVHKTWADTLVIYDIPFSMV